MFLKPLRLSNETRFLNFYFTFLPLETVEIVVMTKITVVKQLCNDHL